MIKDHHICWLPDKVGEWPSDNNEEAEDDCEADLASTTSFLHFSHAFFLAVWAGYFLGSGALAQESQILIVLWAWTAILAFVDHVGAWRLVLWSTFCASSCIVIYKPLIELILTRFFISPSATPLSCLLLQEILSVRTFGRRLLQGPMTLLSLSMFVLPLKVALEGCCDAVDWVLHLLSHTHRDRLRIGAYMGLVIWWGEVSISSCALVTWR